MYVKRDFKKRTQNWAEEGESLGGVEGTVDTVNLYGMRFPKTKTRKKRQMTASSPMHSPPVSQRCLSRILVVLCSIGDSQHSTHFAHFHFCSVKSHLRSASNQTCGTCWISACLCHLTLYFGMSHMPEHSHPSASYTDVASGIFRNLFSYVLWIDFHGSSCFMYLKIICVTLFLVYDTISGEMWERSFLNLNRKSMTNLSNNAT